MRHAQRTNFNTYCNSFVRTTYTFYGYINWTHSISRGLQQRINNGNQRINSSRLRVMTTRDKNIP